MAYVISTWFAIYFVLWWVTLFVTLPFGVRSQHEDGVGAPGSDPGAPIASQTGRKMIWTTAISAVIFRGRHVRLSCRLSLDRETVEADGDAVLKREESRLSRILSSLRGAQRRSNPVFVATLDCFA